MRNSLPTIFRLAILLVVLVAALFASASYADDPLDHAVAAALDEQLDFGDAPDPTFPTLLTHNGARHVIVPGFMLGTSIDGEMDGQPDPGARGDDNDGGNDDDGVVFTSQLRQGSPVTLDVTASAIGVLDAWLDLDGNGIWSSVAEQIFSSKALGAGLNSLSFTLPDTARVGVSFARFRFTQGGIRVPDGSAPGGEVEDYEVYIEQRLDADFGDAPDGVAGMSYPTLLASNGAYHHIDPTIYLGNSIDSESDGQPDLTATGDDIDGNDDEDGAGTFNMVPGETGTLGIVSSVDAYVDIWIDFGIDGSWAEVGDHVYSAHPVTAGINSLPVPIPLTTPHGDSFARFRLSSYGGLPFDGPAADGEVEDIQFRFDYVDYGDAPDPTYPTLYANNGARHVLGGFPVSYLGNSVDDDADGQPHPSALGDDIDAEGDDDDGVVFLAPLIPGEMATVRVTWSSVEAAALDAWIDFGGDGSWAEAGDQVLTAETLWANPLDISFVVPATAAAGTTFARFRISQYGGLSYEGITRGGEVEDHELLIKALDFGDAADPSFPTLRANDGARHQIVSHIYMGTSIDPDSDGQPEAMAMGDDNDGNDDEDGVVFTSPISPALTATVDVTVSDPGYIDAWIDFGDDGDWSDLGDQIFVSQVVVPGLNTLNFSVPPTATLTSSTFVRFRYSSYGGLQFGGLASDGEVEDYEVAIVETLLEFGDAPASYRTLLEDDGARHGHRSGLQLGPTIDLEPNGLPHPNALGDDQNNQADEDGVTLLNPLIPGGGSIIRVEAPGGGKLDAWMDYDHDGSFVGEQMITGTTLNHGFSWIVIPVPDWVEPGPTFIRFRVSSTGGLSHFGLAPNGEVEDYEVFIEEPQVFKWHQAPDLSVEGVDVNASQDFVLADDFLCTETGRITKIDVWGSWLDDRLPFGDSPDRVSFFLSLHADIPFDPDTEAYSRPGEILWERSFQPGTFSYEVFAEGIEEGWLDPPDEYSFPADSTCWKYSFTIPTDEAFRQTGTEDQPIVYWLDLKAYPEDPGSYFGWKTSPDNWNDDAVWGQGAEPYAGPWNELRYPLNHPRETQSIDLAFALQSETEPALDFGDAPDPSYETLLASDGARHVIDAAVYLGTMIDADPDGQPTAAADGDDLLDGSDDEDGVIWITPLRPNSGCEIEVVASAPGFVSLWIDVHGNGNWADPEDQMLLDAPVNPGLNLIQWQMPPTGGQDLSTYARIRYSTVPGLNSWFGPAPDGEVEDEAVRIEMDPTGVGDTTPRRMGLRQNFPNPFNPQTTVEYDLDRDGTVELAVYDQRGALVRMLVDEWMIAGSYRTSWNGRDEYMRPVASGVYMILLRAHGEEHRMKATLVR